MHLVPTIILMLAVLGSSASAQIDLPNKGGREALPGRPAVQPVGADRTSGPAKESQEPALVCTICGLKKTGEAIQWNSVTGLQEAYCKRCQAQQLHRIPDRSKAPSKVEGSLDLPGRRGPGSSPEGKGNEEVSGNQSTQTENLRGAAQVIFAEVGRRRRTDDPLLDQALESLLGMGPDGREACIGALASEHGPTVLVAGRYFLASKDGRDRDLVVERISVRAPGSVGGVLLRILHHVDPVRANPELLAKLIDHPQNSVRAAAHNILKESPKAEWIPLLEPALHSESSDARWRAVDLIASTADAAAVPLMFEYLHDPRAKVAIRAVEFLARFSGEQIEVELKRRAFGERWILRPSAYAVLALVEREDSRQTPLLGPGHVDALLRGMNVKDPFVAGVCAVALAGIGFRAEGQTQIDWLDSIVPSQLVSLIAGQTYFKDREALVDVALRRLQLITAKSTGLEAGTWVDWWTENRRGFRASRAVIPIQPSDALGLRVDCVDRERAQRFSLLGPAWIDRGPPEGTMEAIYLSPEDAREMMELLSINDVFGSQRLPGVWGAELERGRSMSVLVGQHVKTFVFGPGSASPWFERTFASLDALQERYHWQRFSLETLHGDRLGLVRAEGEAFAKATSSMDRAKRAAQLVLTWMAERKPVDRDLGLRELEVLSETSGALGEDDVPAFFELIRGESYWNQRARRLTSLTRFCAGLNDGDKRGSLQAGLGEDLIELLHAKFDVEAAAPISALIRLGGSSAERAAAIDERPLMRGIAAGLLAQRGEQVDVDLLLILLDDAHVAVEVAAVRAAGLMGIQEAAQGIASRAGTGKPVVRAQALRSLGQLGGPKARDVLLTSLTEPGGLFRLPAADGLVALADPRTAEIFFSMLRTGRDADMIDAGSRGLLALGSAAHPTLMEGLHSGSVEARKGAAMILARQGIPEAAPVLIRLSVEEPQNLSILRELRVLSCMDFSGEPDITAAWWSWWDTVRRGDSLSWFRAACEARGMSAPPAVEFEIQQANSTAPAFLLTVLRREETWLAERARRELETLMGGKLDPLPTKTEDRELWIQTLEQTLLRGD